MQRTFLRWSLSRRVDERPKRLVGLARARVGRRRGGSGAAAAARPRARAGRRRQRRRGSARGAAPRGPRRGGSGHAASADHHAWRTRALPPRGARGDRRASARLRRLAAGASRRTSERAPSRARARARASSSRPSRSGRAPQPSAATGPRSGRAPRAAPRCPRRPSPTWRQPRGAPASRSWMATAGSSTSPSWSGAPGTSRPSGCSSRRPRTRSRRQAAGARTVRHRFEALFAGKEDPWDYAGAYEQRKYEQTLSLLPDGPIERALELACAEGRFTEQLAPLVEQLTAADVSRVALQRAEARCAGAGNVTFLELDLVGDELPGELDLIVCSEVLYYAGDRAALDAVAAKLARALKPGGHLVTLHARVVQDEPGRPGFDWGVPFGSKTIGAALADTGGLALIEELRAPLYRVQRFQRPPAAPGSPDGHRDRAAARDRPDGARGRPLGRDRAPRSGRRDRDLDRPAADPDVPPGRRRRRGPALPGHAAGLRRAARLPARRRVQLRDTRRVAARDGGPAAAARAPRDDHVRRRLRRLRRPRLAAAARARLRRPAVRGGRRGRRLQPLGPSGRRRGAARLARAAAPARRGRRDRSPLGLAPVP